MSTLKGVTGACLHLFALAIERLDQQRESVALQDLQEEFDRVRVWAANLGAFAHGHSALDWRLRDMDLMRSTILTLLGLLQESLQEIIESPSSSDSDLNPDIDNDVSDVISLPSDEVSDTSELRDTTVEVYVTTVVELVNNLYRLTFSIRSTTPQPTRASAYRRFDAESSSGLFTSYAKYDHDRLHQVFQDLRQGLGIVDKDEILMKRLATANTTRRRKFKIWSEHAGRTASTQTAVETGESLKGPAFPRTEAVPYNSNLDMTDAESVASVATTAYDSEGLTAPFPPPPRLALEGKDFACPYCHLLCSLKHGTERFWRAHLIRDLEPYVCTHRDCFSGDFLYGSRAEWLHHEDTQHHAVWKCSFHANLDFLTEEALKSHLRQDHIMTDIQIDRFASISRFTSRDKRVECPICLQATSNISDFTLHLANHMENIATFSLYEIETQTPISSHGQKENSGIPSHKEEFLYKDRSPTGISRLFSVKKGMLKPSQAGKSQAPGFLRSLRARLHRRTDKSLCEEIHQALRESLQPEDGSSERFLTAQSCKDVWETYRESHKMSFLQLVAKKMNWAPTVKERIHKDQLNTLSALIWLIDDWENFVELVQLFRLEEQEPTAFENINVSALNYADTQTFDRIAHIRLSDSNKKHSPNEVKNDVKEAQKLFFPVQVLPIHDVPQVIPAGSRMPALESTPVGLLVHKMARKSPEILTNLTVASCAGP